MSKWDNRKTSNTFNKDQNFKNKKRELSRKSNNGTNNKEIELIEYFKQNVLNLNKANYDEYLEKIKEYAKELVRKGFTTSMIRKVYSQIRRIDDVIKLKQLRPQLAYIAGKNFKNASIKNFMDLLDYLIKNTNNKNHIEDFKDFLEAVVAYMKYHGDNK